MEGRRFADGPRPKMHELSHRRVAHLYPKQGDHKTGVAMVISRRFGRGCATSMLFDPAPENIELARRQGWRLPGEPEAESAEFPE